MRPGSSVGFSVAGDTRPPWCSRREETRFGAVSSTRSWACRNTFHSVVGVVPAGFRAGPCRGPNRIWARWYSIVRPDQAYSAKSRRSIANPSSSYAAGRHQRTAASVYRHARSRCRKAPTPALPGDQDLPRADATLASIRDGTVPMAPVARDPAPTRPDPISGLAEPPGRPQPF